MAYKVRFIVFGSIIPRLLAAIIIGALLGGTVVNVLTGQKIDILLHEKTVLQNKIIHQEERLKKFESELNIAMRKFLIQEIQVKVNLPKNSDNPSLGSSLEKIIKERFLKQFLWQEVNTFDPYLIAEIINDREIAFEGTSYRLMTSYLLISEKLLIYIQAKEIIPLPGNVRP